MICRGTAPGQGMSPSCSAEGEEPFVSGSEAAVVSSGGGLAKMCCTVEEWRGAHKGCQKGGLKRPFISRNPNLYSLGSELAIPD